MRAFHRDPKTKFFYLQRVQGHRLRYEIRQGVLWERGVGSAVGCTIHSSDYNLYWFELGIPVVLAYLEDAIFYGLPPGRSALWPEQFLSAIRPGADLRAVWGKFVVVSFESAAGLAWSALTRERRAAILKVSGLFARSPQEHVWSGAFEMAAKEAEAAGGAAAHAAAAAAYSVGYPGWAFSVSNMIANTAFESTAADWAMRAARRGEDPASSPEARIAANRALVDSYIHQAERLLYLLRDA